MASLTSAFPRLRFAHVKPLQADPPSDHLIMVKFRYDGGEARSTAEEFRRQAMEKAESMSEGAKEAWKESTDTTSKSSEKDKFKETEENGNYDKIGKE